MRLSRLRAHIDFGPGPEDLGGVTLAMVDEHCGSLFLRSLPSSDLRCMEPYLELRAFAREEVVQSDGDLIRSVTFPHDMTVSLLCTMADGTTVESATVGTEGYVGVESMLGSAVATGSAVAGHGQASTIPLEQVLILMDQMPALRAAMLAYARTYLAVVFRLAACNAVHTLKQRACRRLLLALDQTEQRPVVMTQDDLARALGVGRTSVNQACQELREGNLISYSRSVIRIDDPSSMTSCACECYLHLKHALLI
jgi:CRP-like cAMP-binding protein